MTIPPDGIAAEERRVTQGEHHDPHRVLGPHGTEGGLVVRVFRPSATALRVLISDRSAVHMQQVDASGLFSAEIPRTETYALQADYADGTVVTFDDPYRFAPTLGDADLYLIGEGCHRDLWRRMGAHHCTHGGVGGTSFAVWAPNARSVRVVGDFNLWDGRLHPM